MSVGIARSEAMVSIGLIVLVSKALLDQMKQARLIIIAHGMACFADVRGGYRSGVERLYSRAGDANLVYNLRFFFHAPTIGPYPQPCGSAVAHKVCGHLHDC